jgi:DNA (cytosine-5)-methyltransferase 1
MACDLKDAIEPAIMTQRMLSRAKEIFENHLVVDSYTDDGDLVAIIRSYAVFDYLKAILESEPNSYVINADVLCAADYGAPQKRNRFVVIGIKKSYTDEVKLPAGSFTEGTYRTVRDAISDLQEVRTVTEVAEDVGTVISKMEDISELGASLRDSDIIFNHIITNTREIAMERFKALKQGQNFHSLDDGLKNNTYTDVSRTQNTIYLRLDYDQPSGTVVNVRKSMWVHPELDRAVSVREAARLQTFPDSFIFCGTKDKQYQQVGNAVPPIMAKAIAKKLAQQLKKIETTSEL